MRKVAVLVVFNEEVSKDEATAAVVAMGEPSGTLWPKRIESIQAQSFDGDFDGPVIYFP